MSIQVSSDEIHHVLRFQPIQLDIQTCIKLVVTSGRLWITTSGDASDFFVHAGESMLLYQKKRRYLLEADSAEPSSYQLFNHCNRLHLRPDFLARLQPKRCLRFLCQASQQN